MNQGHMLAGSFLLATAVILLPTARVVASVAAVPDTTELSAAHGYVETLDGGVGASGINIPGENRDNNGLPKMERKLTSWSNSNSCAVYYIHHPAAQIATSLKLTATKGREVSFRVTVTDPNKPDVALSDSTVTLTGTGAEQLVEVSSLQFPKSAYYRYRVQCLKGNTSINNISLLVFSSSSKTKSYLPNYLSSPSVHLNNWHSDSAPTGSVYDWCYQEVMIPEDADVTGTYCMSLGVLKGYMGIQMNGYDAKGQPRHDVIFSMWDDGSTDEDPNLPEYLKAGAVDAGEGVTVQRFNNEGTGAKTFKSGNNWKAGTFVQFITNVRKETTSYNTIENGKTVKHTQQNTLVSAWYNAQDGKGWQYMATARLRNHNNLFNSWYSFLENYNWPTGQANRKAYYRNGFARKADTGKWYHFNKVGFGHTDGGNKTGARNDYGQGAAKDMAGAFYMQTGAYTSTTQAAQSVALLKDFTPVDTINLQRLIDRVEEGIAKEKAAQEAEQTFAEAVYPKTGWKVISKSSEETTGEGTNGRAQQIVDGNAATYWHSQWQARKAPLPHTIVVDMQKELPVGGYQIKQSKSGSYTRYIKAYDMYLSTDNKTWTKVYTDNDAPDAETFRVVLESAVTARYFKIVVRDSRAPEGTFVRINEIDMAGTGVMTNIYSISEAGETLSVNSRMLTVSAPQTGENVWVSVYSVDGRAIRSFSGAGNYNLSDLPTGLYLIKAKTAKRFTSIKIRL